MNLNNPRQYRVDTYARILSTISLFYSTRILRGNRRYMETVRLRRSTVALCLDSI